MDKAQIKSFVAEKTAEGLSLSKILDLLIEQKVKITFMELRLLATELESVDWSKTDKQEKAKDIAAPAAPQGQDDELPEELPGEEPFDEELPPEEAQAGAEPAKPAGPRGATVVELSKLLKPGALACGSVKFGSGASAEWFLDQYGRLGLDKANGKPDQQDVQEFQAELQKLFEKQGL